MKVLFKVLLLLKAVMEEQNNKITPEKAAEILRKEGKEVTIDEAEKILDFLKNLAKIVVKHYLKTNENS